MQPNRRISWIAALALIMSTSYVLYAGPASADQVSFTETVPVQLTNWSETLNMPQFDAALGTLQSIELTLDGGVEGSASVENTSPTSGTTATLDLSATVTVDSLDAVAGIVTTLPTNTQTAVLDVFDGTIDFGGTSGASFPGLAATESATVTMTDPATLAAYTGVGTVGLTATATAASAAAGGGNLISLFETNASASVTVTYTYAPAAIPGISIEKSPDSQTVVSGSDVTFTITVTNTGQVDLVNVEVTDPQAPDCDNVIGNLAVAAVVTYDCTVTNVTAGFTNVATVTGEDPTGGTVTDNDDAVVDILTPGISIEKSPDSQTVVSGSDVTFTITVTNTGQVDLVNVEVTDPQAPDCDNVIGNLAVAAVVTYDCTVTNVTAGFTNVATVTGEDPTGGTVTDNDDAVVDILTPGISIEKSPDSQTVVSGSDVTFTITVTNTGQVDLVNVEVTDPQAPDCDNVIGNLAVAAVVTYDCTVTNVTAGFTNVATVTGEDPTGGTVTDNDDAVVDILTPGISIEKSPDSQTVVSGSDVTFTITVTNTGQVDLVNVEVTDPQAPDCDNVIGNLAVAAVVTYDCTVTNVTAGFTNVATVTGEDPTGGTVTDNDDAVVDILTPGISIEKSPDSQTVVSGSDVTFTITVTNTGQVDLVNVEVTDPQAPDCDNVIGNLAVAAVVTYDCTVTNVTAGFTNVATVTGEDPTGGTVTDNDDAVVAVASIDVVKVADLQLAAVGQTITYTYTVTNTGEVTLTNIELEDDKLGTLTLATTTLAPGESTTATATYIVTAADLAGPLENIATVTGDADDVEVEAEDDESVDLTDVLDTTLPATGSESEKNTLFGMTAILLGAGIVLVAGRYAATLVTPLVLRRRIGFRIHDLTVGERALRRVRRGVRTWQHRRGFSLRRR